MALDFGQLLYVLFYISYHPSSLTVRTVILSAFFFRGATMNRSIPIKKTQSQLAPCEINRKTAIHEAGHAAAIYIGNKEKQLPPIYFQIFIKKFREDHLEDDCYCPSQARYFASIEGGRLIHTLPSSIDEATRFFSEHDRKAYQVAFEADITNLLVGPLAEAKYVSLRDNELMNPRLINLHALHFYGGSIDLKSAYEYLDCLTLDATQKEKKIAELFAAAYRFVNHPANWSAITAVADYVLRAGKSIIDCEEMVAVIEERLARHPYRIKTAIGF